MQVYDAKIKELLAQSTENIENHFTGDVIYYYGHIFEGLVKYFRDFIEQVIHNSKFNKSKETSKKLIFFLKTAGGSAEISEVIVNIVRKHYPEVIFVIPDYAMSAGTILCMSGDKIYMDYSSYLGPIDPQVFSSTQNQFVPATGYIEKCRQMYEKSFNGKLSDAELFMLRELDLAFLSRCEHACELSKTLIEEWLAMYMFKDLNDKKRKAKEVANKLADTSLWHSHGRCINVPKLKKLVGIEINDYSNDKDLCHNIRNYNDLLTQHVERNKMPFFIHNESFF